MLNFVDDYKLTPHFSDYESEKFFFMVNNDPFVDDIVCTMYWMHLNGHVADETRNDRVPSSDGDIPDAGKGAWTCTFKTSHSEIENVLWGICEKHLGVYTLVVTTEAHKYINP